MVWWEVRVTTCVADESVVQVWVADADSQLTTSGLSALPDSSTARACRSTQQHARLYTQPLVRDYPGRLVPEETLTHSHPSWSSDILHQLPSSTTILSILLVTFTCLTVLFHNLSPGSLWSSSWPWNLSSYSIHFFTQSSSSFHHIIGKQYQAVWLKIKSICSFF